MIRRSVEIHSLADPLRKRPSRVIREDFRDIKWLIDCGWAGWCQDLLTGEIYTAAGDTFAGAKELRAWLQSVPPWPPLTKDFEGHMTRDVPKRRPKRIYLKPVKLRKSRAKAVRR